MFSYTLAVRFIAIRKKLARASGSHFAAAAGVLLLHFPIQRLARRAGFRRYPQGFDAACEGMDTRTVAAAPVNTMAKINANVASTLITYSPRSSENATDSTFVKKYVCMYVGWHTVRST